MGTRLLVWLLASVALAVPPMGSGAPHASQAHHAAIHCPDHPAPASPDKPCPDHGTAKHAAGACCAFMAGALAVMPSSDSAIARPQVRERTTRGTATLSGQSIGQDPPPPRM